MSYFMLHSIPVNPKFHFLTLYHKVSCSQRMPVFFWEVKACSDSRKRQESDRRKQDHQGPLICRHHRVLLTSFVGIFFQSVCVFFFVFFFQCVAVTWHKEAFSLRMGNTFVLWITSACMVPAATAVGSSLKEK